jgi:hypothetical protein
MPSAGENVQTVTERMSNVISDYKLISQETFASIGTSETFIGMIVFYPFCTQNFLSRIPQQYMHVYRFHVIAPIF